jgi:Holliday junction resolvasome RuvABC endonuclease subunit
MATLSIDGGAERLGWALLEKGIKKPVYLQSGLVEFPRGDGNA